MLLPPNVVEMFLLILITLRQVMYESKYFTSQLYSNNSIYLIVPLRFFVSLNYTKYVYFK